MLVFNYIRWNVDSDLFVIPFLNHPVRWYGILWMLGLYLAYRKLSKVFEFEGKSSYFIEKLSTYLVIGVFTGARLGHVLFYEPSYYFSNPLKILAIYEGGLASHGGGIGMLIAILLFVRRFKVNFYYIADRIALVVPLVGAFIRLGNLMNSEIIGNPTNVSWGFIFEKVDQIPRHPAQIYEALFCFFLFFVLRLMWKSSIIRNLQGSIFGTLLILLFVFRFFIEMFKDNQVDFEDGMFVNMGQILSIPFIIVGIIILIKNSKKSYL